MMYGYGLAPHGGFGMHGYYGLGGWLIPMGLGLLVVIGIALWFVYANRGQAYAQQATYSAHVPLASGASGASGTQPDTAESIVRERFARGEIDRDEYDRLVSILRR